jgi:Skp family chaperone for outer membrane proteins
MGIIEEWLNDQTRSATRRQYHILFRKFWSWVQQEGLFETPEELLNDYERKEGKAKYFHVAMMKSFMRWLRDEADYSINSRSAALNAIRSFYAFNHTPFPKITRQDRRKMFEPTEKEIQKQLESNPVKLDDLKSTLMEAEEPYRTILQIMFQSGMGLEEFQYFNRHGWSQIKNHLNDEGPMKIKLFRRKTSEGRVHTYYTFLGNEGKESIKRWLRIRESKFGLPKEDEPIFLTIQKRNGAINAPAKITIQHNLIHAMKKAGVVPPNAKGPYDLHVHELRDMFKSMCTLSGVNRVASEFFLGHTIDRLGYDKSPKYDEDFFKREYSKVEPKLNLWSQKPSEAVEIIQLRNRVKELEAAFKTFPEVARTLSQAEQFQEWLRIQKETEYQRDQRDEWENQQQFQEDALRSERSNQTTHASKIQQVIMENEVEEYLNKGWIFIATLNSNKVIVEKS